MNQSTIAVERKPRVLIADDDPSVRLLLKHFLETENYQTHEVADGEQALEALLNTNNEENSIDIILLDAVMPKLNGFQACRKIKQDNSELPVIIITSLDDDASVEQAFRSGADDYITKPINWSVLKHRILRAKNKSIQQALHEANELEAEITHQNYNVALRPRISIDSEQLNSVITSYNLQPKKKRLLKPNTALPLKIARQLIYTSCEAFLDLSQGIRLTLHIYPFSGNPMQYVSMLREVLETMEIPVQKVDCVFNEAQIQFRENIHLYNALSELPVNLHIGKFAFSLHAYELIQSSRCDALELDIPLLYNTLKHDYSRLNAMLDIYNPFKLKLIGADITIPDELNLARQLHCNEAHGPALGIGKLRNQIFHLN